MKNGSGWYWCQNWCQIIIVIIYAKKTSWGHWRLYINEIASTYGRVEAIEICSKKALFYSHSIVADGFGDIS
jgi:hypothetical protein